MHKKLHFLERLFVWLKTATPFVDENAFAIIVGGGKRFEKKK